MAVSKDDPKGAVVARYKVFVNKIDKPVLLLRFPNRDQNESYSHKNESEPLALRIKPKSGLIEIDVPVHTSGNFDRVRGIEYAQALNSNRTLRANGSLGLGGGLGAAPIIGVKPGADDAEKSSEYLLDNFNHAVREGKVLNKLTLSGQISKPKSGDAPYFIGGFRDRELHLTRISAFCTLNPGLHHLDALVENERVSARAARDLENPPADVEAKEVQLTVKTAEDRAKGEEDKLFELLQQMQEEPWQSLAWVDENEENAYTMFDRKMFLDDDESSGKRLTAALTKEQYLDLISAPRIDPIMVGKRIMRNRTYSNAGASCDESTDASEGEEFVESKKDVGKGRRS